jgi:hypothetical protein
VTGLSAKRIKAFVSYSWDSSEHIEWVTQLVNDLRATWGIEASIDRFELYERTVNLNTMMIHALRDNDYVIIVLTEEYAKKAEAFTGGVRFETVLSLPILKQHPDKLIPIMRHTGEFLKVFPFHLQDLYAIDFSDPRSYDEKLKELAYRLYKQNPVKKAPLGPIPQFDEPHIDAILEGKPKGKEEAAKLRTVFSDLSLQKFKEPTDLEKANFMNESFNRLSVLFDDLFKQLQDQDHSIEFSKDELSSLKHGFTIFVNGKRIAAFKMWLSKEYGSSSIKFSFNPHGWESDNSFNEMVTCEVDKDKTLTLKMTMSGFMGNTNANEPESIVRVIWKQHLEHHFK